MAPLSGVPARVLRRVAQLLRDPQELLVLRHPVRPARAPGLDLPAPRGHGQVRDDGIRRLPGPVADDVPEPVPAAPPARGAAPRPSPAPRRPPPARTPPPPP